MQGRSLPMGGIKKSLSFIIVDLKNLSIALIAFAVYSVIAHLFFERYCPLVVLTGLPCPGCGMTRASLLLISGHFKEALIMHPMVLSVFVLFFAYGLFKYILYIDTRHLQNILIFIIIAGLFVYLFRMFTVFPEQTPMKFYNNNIFRKILTFIDSV